ncbi:hypothetical protein TrVE_jg2234 [Triparma verrucosa]|uniref:Right handed beta helix domain-containing protein n=1 Tax=Triparma verrucosa TaxID=1606542 RepID=A0A9W7BEZ3_9STRA|nr:hypothetical protein TrVE_jg2234 [Triparma verrucosa]
MIKSLRIFLWYCWLSPLASANNSFTLSDGWSTTTGTFVGNYTSQIRSFIDLNYEPVSDEETTSTTQVNGETILRRLTLEGTYLADVPLDLPSLFVLELSPVAKILPAKNLTLEGSERFAALVQMNNTVFSSLIGGTIDATSVDVTDPEKGYMAVSITGGSKNAVRNVRAMANNSFSVIGVNESPHAEVSNSIVGGDADTGMLQTRCIWTLVVSNALVHDNRVSYCSMHALDFDAYTSSSVAWNNHCDHNGQEGIFLEESADHCVLFNNTVINNENGISVYSNEVGPVQSNFILNNLIKNNRRNGLSSGGNGKDASRKSFQNIFSMNHVEGNAWDQSDTAWGPAPKAQVNPAHGDVDGDYWTSNVVVGDVRYEDGSELGDADQLAIFEPEIF